jgi:hypothetical protein
LLKWKLKTSAQAIHFMPHLSRDVVDDTKASPLLIMNQDYELQLLALKTLDLTLEKVREETLF